IFERFLNPDRISIPDIDIDFCMDRRGEVIEYVRARYGGASNVAQIITFGAMKAKAVVRDVARVLDMPYAQADKIAKLIPNDLKITIEKALEEEPRLRAMEKESPEVARLLRVSRALEGTARHASTHAAGVVISPEPLIHYLPLYKAPDKEDITTQYQMGDVEKLGLLKMDFLGLRTLTVIHNTAAHIRKNHDPAFDIDLVALDDAKTFELLGAARTLGVFQLESSGMRDLIRKMKPTTFQDIIALVALFRPGPINSGMADQYVKRKHGHEEVTYEFPQAREALEETYGVIVYQEQVMKIANLLAGFTMAQADALRKAMGKKKQEIMDQLRDKFVSGAVKLGHEQKKAAALWENIEKFGEYGFNKSHSACYALVAYQTAYLKAHYPAEYMAALLSSEADNTDKAQRYLQECRDLKLAVAPPDVNKSQSEFAVVEGAVRFGLSAIKGMGETAARAIIEARDEGGPFASLADMAGRVKPQTLNRRAMEAMVKCGAFDFTGKSRAGLFGSVEQALGSAQKAQRDREIGQSSLFAALGGAAPEEDAALDLPEWPEKERLAYEKEALGFYLSGHPLNASAADLRRLATFTTATLANAAHRAEARMGGMIIARKYMNNKKGERFARVTLEDLAGSVEALIWPDVLAKNLELVESEEPVFIKGQADVDDENGAKLIAQEI
ncbi:MAG: DNA polymerase III subunit alpha, partial [Nitrospinae bacterium]|nr:DNA polymerase III subunit alpha [Nitrospinota bacterium]